MGQVTWSEDERALLPLLPMIYVAWADGELTDEEIGQVRAVADGLPGLTGALDDWLDPARPPDAARLRDLLGRLRTASRGLPAASLPALGMAIARADAPERWASPEAEAAVHDAASALCLTCGDAITELLPRHTDRTEWDPIEPDTLPVEALQALLTGPYPADRAATLAVLADPAFRHHYGQDTPTHRQVVSEWIQRIADAGLAKVAFPVTDADGGIGRFVAVFETLAWFDLGLTIKCGVQFGLFGGSIWSLGTARHHARYLPRVASVELPGCFAMTERGHGSNVRQLETTAVYDPARETFTITTPHDRARKEWIGNAARDGRMATVFAQLHTGGAEHGVHAFLVPIRDAAGAVLPGVRIADCGEKMGLHGVDNGQLWFDGVEVPRDNLLDRFATVDADGTYHSPIASAGKRFFTMLGTLVGGRVSVGGAAVSAAQVALTIAVRYGARRRQFGPDGSQEMLILDYRAHQRRLMPRLATTVVLTFARQRLLEQFVAAQDDGELSRTFEAAAAGLKAYATRHATDTIQVCRECCGGQGYSALNRFADLKADSDVFTTFEGDNTVLYQLVARSLLTEFKAQFSDNRIFGLARHLGRRALTAVTARNPVIIRWTDADHLRGIELHRELFRAREADLLSSVATRLRRRMGEGQDPFLAVNDCQQHLIALAVAHVEREALEAMHTALVGADDALRPVLETVGDLFALGRIEADLGWFLENGYLDASKGRAIRKQVDALCGELRTHAVGLVAAFGIPDHCVGAPIGLRRGTE